MENTPDNKDKIYKTYYPKVLNYCRGKVNSPEDAEDLAANVFVKVFSKLDTFDETKASISTWIYTITGNLVIDFYRTNKITTELPEEIVADGAVEDGLMNEDSLQELADALMKLEIRERDIIIFKYYNNMTLKEAAVKMGMSYANIKIVHNKALNKLKKYLQY